MGLAIAEAVFNAGDEARLEQIAKRMDAIIQAHPLYPQITY